MYLTGWHKGWLTLAIISIITAFVSHIFPYRGDLIIPTFSLILVAATSLIRARNHCYYTIAQQKDTTP